MDVFISWGLPLCRPPSARMREPGTRNLSSCSGPYKWSVGYHTYGDTPAIENTGRRSVCAGLPMSCICRQSSPNERARRGFPSRRTTTADFSNGWMRAGLDPTAGQHGGCSAFAAIHALVLSRPLSARSGLRSPCPEADNRPCYGYAAGVCLLTV